MPPDRFLRVRAVPLLTRAEVARLSTRQLLARLRKLQGRFESLAALGLDYDAEDARAVEGISFKIQQHGWRPMPS